MRSIQYTVFSIQEGVPSRGSAFQSDVLGAPHSDAENSHAQRRKEQANCLRFQLEEVLQYSVFSIQKYPQRAAEHPGLFLIPSPQNLVPNEQMEFAS